MVETKKSEYWNGMAKRGEIDSEIATKLSHMQAQFIDRTPNTIFKENGDMFLESFETELKENIQSVMDKFPELTKKDARLQAENAFNSIHQFLITIHVQKALSEITFPAFPLFKFLEAFSGIFDETQFQVTPECMTVRIMDPSRIYLLQVKFSNESFTFYQEGKFSSSSQG